MKASVFLAALILSTAYSFAEDANSSLRQELDQEIEDLYPKIVLKPKRKGIQQEVLVIEDAPSQMAAVKPVSQSQSVPVNINVDQYDVGPNVVSRPTTIIEATPLEESKSDRMRKKRLQLERATEAKIVERLENDRIAAEEKRMSELQALLEGKSAAAPAVTAYDYPQRAVVVDATPTIVDPVIQPKYKNEIVGNHEALISTSAYEGSTRLYITALGGAGDYLSADNVRSNFSAGVATGAQFPQALSVELSAIFSGYDIDVFTMTGLPSQVEMKQLNFSLAAKYSLLDKRVRPNIGAIFTYTRRRFSEKYDTNSYLGLPQGQPTLPSSTAFDAGFTLGIDFELGRNFFIGTDFKYLFNLSHRRNQNFGQFLFNSNQLNPIEKFSYYLFTVSGSFRF